MKLKFGFFPLLSRLGKDARGTILLQSAVYMIAVFGFMGLALDGARWILLHSSLQDMADAAALAGATQLNGTLGATTRATAAAQAMANNNPPRWYNTGGSATITTLFYSSLDPDTANTSDKDARYIKVTTDVTADGISKIAPTFLAAVGAVSKPASATAMAKSTGGQCFNASMMLCNPFEPLTGSTGDTSNFNPPVGGQYRFSVEGNTGGYSPGVFNLLDTPQGSGSDVEIKKFLSQQNPEFCFTGGTNPAQGQKTNATKLGINVRFDDIPNGNTTGMDVTTAPIVIDGLTSTGPGNNCNKLGNVAPPHSPPSLPLPEDASFNPPTMSQGGSQAGTGTSDPAMGPALDAYWQNHHGANWPTVTVNGVTRPITRYEAYLREVPIANGGLGTATTFLTDGVEPHGPVCGAASTAGADRRLVKVAIVDCAYWNVHGNAVNDIPITTYADFFLIRPTGSNNFINVEYVQKHDINAVGSLLRNIVQLVR